MSRSSSDVFEDIAFCAERAKEYSNSAEFHGALAEVAYIKAYLAEARQRLEYEIKCKEEFERSTW